MRVNNLNTYWQWGLIAASLIIGLSIYILFRQNILFVEFLFGMEQGMFCHIDKNAPLLYFIVFCLPDGLWYLALLHTNKLINNLLKTPNDRFAVSIDTVTISAPFILEIGQATGYLAGTFDICDVMTYLFTLITYSIWTRKKSAIVCN